MAENKNNFQNNVDSLFKGLDNFLTTKSVVGQPVQVGESIMIPLADVSFGMGAGAMSGSSRDNGGGGMGAKISPAAVLLIAKDGTTKLVNMKSQDAVAKIIDMAPDIITKIKSQFGPENNSDDFAE
jgi:uncharacterized spore protein YtfJ|uniref:Sporulation protein YtfJ n=1 Tax=Eubacterium cellulosolvens (strain ATCC 43171 / JCM 9499 / 6) TaxID=633697 RepID=I5AQJ6_EUBC6|nr:spore germination protein GerW family protein [[Eubacterium] cellulosolvens]